MAVLEEDRSRLSDRVKLGRSHTQNDQMRNAALDGHARPGGEGAGRCHVLEEQLAQANADAQAAVTAAAAEAERGSDCNCTFWSFALPPSVTGACLTGACLGHFSIACR